ncbi:hypothetical protein [Roseibium sediminicola]|uniref:Cell division protein FtsQ n=1 Tax=Roseibium sediminicola TaxID=2933272 RepID=A0ABT0GUC1_9HYPH|nr:hypothetical protein [Roseibium sp. CAU 1639]MCK7613043.1 hypothetical protein [Roseibium sp. CAU 1639]
MATQTQSINENRGARRAAELRRRFAHVSNTSFGRPSFGLRPAPAGRSHGFNRSRRAQLQEFLGWSMLAAVVMFIGFLIF